MYLATLRLIDWTGWPVGRGNTSRIWIGDLGVTHWAQDHDNGVDVPRQDADYPPR
jgi:hypothetical protein